MKRELGIRLGDVPHVGVVGRVLAWAFALVIVFGGVVGLLPDDRGGIPMVSEFLTVAGVVAGPVTLALRSLTLGITLYQRGFLVRSWFSSYCVFYSEIRTIESVPYSGLINWYNVSFSGTYFRMLRLTGHSFSGGARNLEMTLALEPQTRLQVEMLNSVVRSQNENGIVSSIAREEHRRG
jgi:hypothetical protein